MYFFFPSDIIGVGRRDGNQFNTSRSSRSSDFFLILIHAFLHTHICSISIYLQLYMFIFVYFYIYMCTYMYEYMDTCVYVQVQLTSVDLFPSTQQKPQRSKAGGRRGLPMLSQPSKTADLVGTAAEVSWRRAAREGIREAGGELQENTSKSQDTKPFLYATAGILSYLIVEWGFTDTQVLMLDWFMLIAEVGKWYGYVYSITGFEFSCICHIFNDKTQNFQ